MMEMMKLTELRFVDTSEETAAAISEPRAVIPDAVAGPSTSPTYRCVKCPKSYTTKHGYNKHLMSHRVAGKLIYNITFCFTNSKK